MKSIKAMDLYHIIIPWWNKCIMHIVDSKWYLIDCNAKRQETFRSGIKVNQSKKKCHKYRSWKTSTKCMLDNKPTRTDAKR